MDSLLQKFTDDTIESPIELEIRYKDVSLEMIFNLLTYMNKNYKIKHETFIDSIDYKQSKKIGMRTYLNEGKKVNVEPIYKERIEKVMITNPICDYSVDLSTEKIIDISQLPKNPTNILLKHRYSYKLPEHSNWRVDITITRKSELTAEGIKRSVNEFFINISSLEQLFNELRKKKFNYIYNMEVEFIGSKKTNIREDDIKKISTLPFKIVDENVESKLYYIQELDYIQRTINFKINNEHKKITREPTSLKVLLPAVKTITRQQYNDIFPPINYLLTDKRMDLGLLLL